MKDSTVRRIVIAIVIGAVLDAVALAWFFIGEVGIQRFLAGIFVIAGGLASLYLIATVLDIAAIKLGIGKSADD